MSDGKDDDAWRQDYPWGRKPPGQRIAELEARRREVSRRRRLLEDRFREALAGLDRMEEAIDADLGIARRCEADRMRRMAKSIAHRLLAHGIDVFGEIADAEPSEVLIDRLREMEVAAAGSGQPEHGFEDLFSEDNLPDDGVVDPDEIAGYAS